MTDEDETGVGKKFKPLPEEGLLYNDQFPIDGRRTYPSNLWDNGGLPKGSISNLSGTDHGEFAITRLENLERFTKRKRDYPAFRRFIDKDRLFEVNDALFGRLNPEPDNEH